VKGVDLLVLKEGNKPVIPNREKGGKKRESYRIRRKKSKLKKAASRNPSQNR